MKEVVLKGIVIHGDKLGKKLGYPTANLNWTKKKKLSSGIYAATVRVLKKEYQGVAVIGVPSMIDGKPKLEVHILDFNKMIYDEWLSAVLVKKIRKLKNYKSKQELIKTIKKDCQIARKILKND